MAFRALWQTPNRANARLKATLGGFHGPLTFFIENPSFFHNSFILYPKGRKATSLIPKNALPRRNSDLLSRCSKKSLFLKNPHCMAWRAGEFGFVYCREREPCKRAAESHQVEECTSLPQPCGGVGLKPHQRASESHYRWLSRPFNIFHQKSGFFR